jgi:hypothetical protein
MLKRMAFGLLFMLMIGIAPAAANSDIGSGGSVSCSADFNTFSANAAASVTQGSSTIFAAYRQVSGNNQDPVIARFTSGTQDWCNDGYETTGDDGRAYGLYWDGGGDFYGIFSATGTQPGDNYTRFTQNGWLTSYGSGGGGKVIILLRINATTGAAIDGTYVTARLSNGNSNSAQATGIDVVNGNVVLRYNAWFSPRNTDKSAMSCSGGSPFDTYIEFNGTLTTAIGTTASRCTPNSSTNPPPNAPVPGIIQRISPTDGAQDVDRRTVLRWDEDAHSTWYEVYLAGPNGYIFNQWFPAQTTPGGTPGVCSGGDCEPSSLSLANGEYTWWMRSWGPGDTTTHPGFYGHWRATTFYVGQPPPGEITRNGPNGSVNAPAVTFTWQHDPSAEWYRVFVSGGRDQWFAATDAIGNPFGYDGVCGGSTCTVPASVHNWWFGNGNYTWWIAGYNSSGLGAWSSTGMNFSLNLPTPSGLVIEDPGTVSAGTVTISWDANADSSWYQLWVGGGGTHHYQWHQATDVCGGTACSVQVTVPAGESEIWLRSWGPGGMSDWTGPVAFTAQ